MERQSQSCDIKFPKLGNLKTVGFLLPFFSSFYFRGGNFRKMGNYSWWIFTEPQQRSSNYAFKR